LLKRIQSFFGVGNITINKKNGQAIYSVKSVNDINRVIIPHFDKYLLITKKRADYLLFKKVVELITQKLHLEEEGLIKILGIKASLNKGLTPELIKAFSTRKMDITPTTRPIINLPKILDIN